MMNSEIEKFYRTENLPSSNELDFWQHRCGLFNWHISGENVSMCCTDPELKKISWPDVDRENRPEGLK